MFETALHRRVVLAVALVALSLSGAVAGTAVSTTAPTAEMGPSAPLADATPDANHAVTPDATATVTLGSADGDPLVLRSAPNQIVRVESNVPAGTELAVRVRSARSNLLKSSRVTIGDDGTGTATFNLSRVEPGTTFTASVSADGRTEVEGVVVAPSATVHRDATFAVADPTSEYALRGRVLDDAVGRLDVRYSAPGTTHSASRTVTVREDGTFAATFDLSSVPTGTRIDVEVGGIPRSVTPVVVTDENGTPTVYSFVETPANATIRYPAKTFLVHAAPDQTVRGTTNLRPGTEITVTAVNDAVNSPRDFSRSANVTVREDGSFDAALNFSGVEPGTNFSVRVGSGLTTAEGRVVNDSVTLPTVTTTTATPTTVNESRFPSTTTLFVDTTTPDDSPGGHVDGFGVPGFGVPVAIVALLAGLGLARRR